MTTYEKYFGLKYDHDDFFVNLNLGEYGEREIHRGDCSFLPEAQNRVYLGKHSSYNSAKISAIVKVGYKKYDGCAYCCPENHTC